MDIKKMPPVAKVALAFSGGLDSILCIKLLEEYYNAKEIILVLVDVGQGSEEIATAREKAQKIGLEPIIIDAQEKFLNQWIAKAIMANGLYGEYAISSSMTRQLIASEVATIALREGCDAVAEGSTGKGNDQFRFHNTFKFIAPSLKIIAPVRDFNLSRVDERKLANRYGISFYAGISDDKTIWGRAIGSGEVDSLVLRLPQYEYFWWVPQQDAPEEPTVCEIEFKGGIPTRVNNQEGLGQVISFLNQVGGKNSIGRIDTIEDGIMGLKSREVYEAPAATILLSLHKDLERLCLTKEELRFKAGVDSRWADLVYHGGWFHPLKENLDAFIGNSQKVVNAKVKVQLYKGCILILERQSDYSLFEPEIRSLEIDSFDQREASAAVEILGIEYLILNARNNRVEGGRSNQH